MTLRRALLPMFSIALITGAYACSASQSSSGGDGDDAAGGSVSSGAGAGGGTTGGATSGGGQTSITAGSGGGFLVGGQGPTGCAEDTHTGTLVPLDLVIMLDHSASMQDDDKWTNVTSALESFINLPAAAGISVSIGYFPVPASNPPPSKCTTSADCGAYGPCEPALGGCLGAIGGADSCDFTDYQTPDVPLGELPGNAQALDDSIDKHQPDGNSTPTSEGLGGALTYAHTQQEAHPDHIVIVVLATDGEPMACTDNDTDHVVSVAAQGLQYGIKTFVIGIGTSMSGDQEVLDQIADAGGTMQAFSAASGSAASDFANALNTIRGTVKCQYSIPMAPAGQTLDPHLVNVSLTPADGSPAVVIPQVTDVSACGTDAGWYYDDPNNPAQIILCSATCDGVEMNGMSGTIDVLVGCATIIK